MERGCFVAWTISAAALIASCSAPTAGEDACRASLELGRPLAVVAEALRGGAPTERLLALAPEQQAAVVALYPDADFEAAASCSGVLVSTEHILTAAHCVDHVVQSGTRLAVRFGPDADQPDRVAEVSEIELHPSADLALLVLRYALSDEDRITAIAPSTRALEQTLVGRQVAVAGYGLDDELTAGTRAYGVVRIDGLEPEHVRVTGVGRTGLCFGDSGGPLIARARDGRVAVLGVLAGGSAGCDGTDRFTRLDRTRAWLEASLPAAPELDDFAGCASTEAR